MPIYAFECKCGNAWEAFFGMNDEKKPKCPKCKKSGKRVFINPNMGIDTKINPKDIKRLVKKTGDMKGGTIGSLWDLAAETSEQRGGEHDPIRIKAEADYAKLRKGKKYRPGSKNRAIDIQFGG